MLQSRLLIKPRNYAFRTFYISKIKILEKSPHLHVNVRNDSYRLYADNARKPNFFTKLVDNIKQEMAKNKEMKENLKKFREEAEKLEHSDALKKARQKYQTVESEASRSTEAIKEKLGTFKGKVQEALEEASKSDLAKKAGT